MNQDVVCGHLARVGLQTVIAENGKAGLDMVAERKNSGEKPFDLIFMDMFMPVMDGLEAASKITALNTGAPIVAMTANVMSNDIDSYRKYGMVDYLSKPFTTQELWRCLLKYLKPLRGADKAADADRGRGVGGDVDVGVDVDVDGDGDDGLMVQLKADFVRRNQTIDTALSALTHCLNKFFWKKFR